MVTSEEKGHAHLGTSGCATNSAEENITDGAKSNSVADAQKACEDALKEVYATMNAAQFGA